VASPEALVRIGRLVRWRRWRSGEPCSSQRQRSIRDSRFENNSVEGGESGGSTATDGLAKGGAIFALHDLDANANGNERGMPAFLPEVTGCGNEFFENSVTPSPAGTDTDNNDTFGTSRADLVEPCPVVEAVPVIGGNGSWLLSALLAVAGFFGLKSLTHRRDRLRPESW
jgi:hypothetical protein